MKTNRIITNTIIAAVAAITALCSTVRPVHADLTGPKPPKIVSDYSAPVSPTTGETR